MDAHSTGAIIRCIRCGSPGANTWLESGGPYCPWCMGALVVREIAPCACCSTLRARVEELTRERDEAVAAANARGALLDEHRKGCAWMSRALAAEARAERAAELLGEARLHLRLPFPEEEPIERANILAKIDALLAGEGQEKVGGTVGLDGDTRRECPTCKQDVPWDHEKRP